MADAETMYELRCIGCGAGVRPIDRFCSQCGRRDPTGTDDSMLTEPTLIAEETAPGEMPTLMKKPTGGADVRPKTVELQLMLVPGAIFGRRYRIQRFLGAGAMGYVCSAVDESIDETIALKILSVPIQEDPDSFERFKMELKLARKIRHRNVVQSFDLGFAEGYPFISMEYIDADNLLKHLNRKPSFDEVSALGIMRQVIRGLRAAHDLGIVHRDIKPENILLNKDRMAFITDFGIATTQVAMRKKELAGTPDYMAPEQLRMEEVGPPSDLYACGVLLHRMLTGSLPYRASSVPEIIDAHLNATPLSIPESAGITLETRELIGWMLQKRMTDRPQNASAVLERIDETLRAAATRRSGAKHLTILVVEHDPAVRSFIAGVLQAEGIRVIATGDGREAVNLAFEQAPALILLDARIQGGFDVPLQSDDEHVAADSLGFVRLVRQDEKLRGVPIVLMTDRTLSELDRTFTSAGVADVMVKPLDAAEVMEAVSNFAAPPASQ
jgi:CheY-like chemotaxis protein